MRALTCLLVFVAATGSLRGLDPNRHISQYAHTAWRLQDGALSGAPNAITQTTDGYVWIGTDAGLVRFDGVRFVPWKPPDGKRLLDSSIYSLLATRDGALWVGTGKGLSQWHDQNLVNYPDTVGRINSITEDRDGKVWIARSRPGDARGPLCQVMRSSLACYGKADGIPSSYAEPLIGDAAGNLWLGSSSKITRWRPGDFATWSPSGLSKTEGLSGVRALALASDGSVFAGMARSGAGLGLRSLMDDIWKPFTTSELNGETLEISSLFVDRENSLWIGTGSQGIYRIHDGKVDHFRSTDGLSGDTVNGFCEDREGNLWVTTSKGIDSFRGIPVVSYSTSDGLSSNFVSSILTDHNGTLWIGNQGSLDFLHQGKISAIRKRDGLPGSRVTSLMEDHAGRLWVGIDNGLAVYEKGRFSLIKRPDGSPIGVIIAMTEDVDENVWAQTIGSPTRLVRIKDRKVFEEAAPPMTPPALSLAADPKGGIWLGLANGNLVRYKKEGQLATYPIGKNASRINDLLVDLDGSLWGATSSGLIRWHAGEVKVMNVLNGLPCNQLYGVIRGKQGAFWLYAQCGIIAISSSELQRWWENPATTVKFRFLDVFDGAQPKSPSFRPDSSMTPDGRLWFANEIGVQMVDPSKLEDNQTPPPVHIEEIVADRKSYLPQQGLLLPAITRELEIDYTALSFVTPQKVFFRYKLEGQETGWHEAATRRQAFYNDLHPGKYRFQVVACNNDGVWNNVGAALVFTIAPAWYQTKWFLLLCVVSLAFFAWLIYELRVRQVASALSARFDERLAERTRLARDLHDTLLQTIQGSKMVADDALDATTDPVQMRKALEQLSLWQGQAMQEGRAALHSLRSSTTESNNLSESFRRVAEACLIQGSMGVDVAVTGGSKDMHPIVRDEIYRIGHEAIRNACLHSNGSRLEIGLYYAQDFVLRIVDNGKGIDPVVSDLGKAGHFGLKGMRERANRISAKLNLISSPKSGTEVNLTVPGHIIFLKTLPKQFTFFTRLERLLGRDKDR